MIMNGSRVECILGLSAADIRDNLDGCWKLVLLSVLSDGRNMLITTYGRVASRAIGSGLDVQNVHFGCCS